MSVIKPTALEESISAFRVTGAIIKALAPDNKLDSQEITIAKIVLLAIYVFSGLLLTTLFLDFALNFASLFFHASERSVTCLSSAGKGLKTSFDDVFAFGVKTSYTSSYRRSTEAVDTFFAIFAITTLTLIFMSALESSSRGYPSFSHRYSHHHHTIKFR